MPLLLTDEQFLTAELGSVLTTAFLTTQEHRAQARTAFQLIADRDGPHIARAWFHGMNPNLDNANPLHAIQAGHGLAVITAAQTYVRGDNAN